MAKEKGLRCGVKAVVEMGIDAFIFIKSEVYPLKAETLRQYVAIGSDTPPFTTKD
jgi:hypothetical protein